MTLVDSGEFVLLGAPIGNATFCAAYTASERITKAQNCLDGIADLDDPQVALTLLRYCASYGKIVYSMRVTPHDHHYDELRVFDRHVRSCFESFSGLYPNDTQWRQATLAVRHAVRR